MQTTKLFDHFVASIEQKMRNCELAELGPREESEFAKSNLRMSDRDHSKLWALALMQPEDSVHGA